MEIYLSRIVLNGNSRDVWRDVANPRDLHRTISGGFPPIQNADGVSPEEKRTPRNAYRLLHRLDRKDGLAVLYIQSSIRPNWENLRRDYAQQIDSKPVHDQYAAITNGMKLVFRLQANPTKRAGKNDIGHAKFRDEGKRRRIDIRTEEGRIKWLERKGGECGFRLTRISVSDQIANVDAGMRPSFKFRHTGQSKDVTLGSAVFEGVLEVTDADAFRHALANGIGSGKAYGFGLMSVAPA